MTADAFVGIDLGTSSVRCTAIDAQRNVIAGSKHLLAEPLSAAVGHYEQDPQLWWQATQDCLQKLLQLLTRHRLVAIAVDGTSGTLLLADSDNNPIGNALMYNDSRATAEAAAIAAVAPSGHICSSASSSLARLLYLLKQHGQGHARYALHQADWIMAKLSGKAGVSDENNCLKLGYDATQRRWPDWLSQLADDIPALLPEVHPSGKIVGSVAAQITALLGLDNEVLLISGTTDSTASSLAAGIAQEGDAVTTIGTTLVTKIVARQPVFAERYGIYSHRVKDDLWLVGGASNCGGRTLQQYFEPQQIAALSLQIDPRQPTDLDYYPLPAPGERFPINDPMLQPRLSPRPKQDFRFLQAIFEGLAQVEKLAYQRLLEQGAPQLARILTAGGAASSNPALQQIRQLQFSVPVIRATHTEASYGAALIARQAVIH